MAPQPPKTELEALTARIAASRASLGAHAAGLRERLDFPARIRSSITDSIRRHPLAVIGGTIGLGFIATRLFRRPRTARSPKPGLGSLAFTTILALVKPALLNYLTREIQRRFAAGPTQAP